MKPSEKRLLWKSDGFTLIEILVVLIIIGLLSALVAPKFFGKIDKAKVKTAKAQIGLLGAALDDFRLDVGRYPTTDEGLEALVEQPSGVERWNGPYLKKKQVPKDPWGYEYAYRSPGEHGGYDLYSLGADHAEGGEGENKDVLSWE